MTALTMVGHDRTYQAPRSLRTIAAGAAAEEPLAKKVSTGKCEAWDLLALETHDTYGHWARCTSDSILASIETETKDALDCPDGDCADTGFYGITADGNEDLLTGLLRRNGEDTYEILTAAGIWEVCDGELPAVEQLSLELAEDLAGAITAGAAGLLRKYAAPLAFLPPAAITAAVPVLEMEGTDPFAVVDDDDPGAVLQIARLTADGDMQRLVEGSWEDWGAAESDLLGIPLDEQALNSILATGLVADAPLTVSPNPKAEKLRRYWSTGKGAAKIRWNTPGDWKRCYRHLRKYMGPLAKGYCQNLHKRDTGVWTGDRRNVGNGLRSSAETSLAAAIQSGQWTGESEGTNMPAVDLKDGIYSEVDENEGGILRTLTAGGFPVSPPDEWFDQPSLEGPTPLTVADDGRVYGHIATFDIAHIGMPGNVRAPKSKSNYAYFRTGELVTASGKRVSVGQITLAGGHAPLHADAGAAVAHYDNTKSGVADVAAGEDRYGIWVAGAVRPDVTPEQVRALRASAPSGDWRPLNGNLELVAVCQVNVPGFPVARARVAGGAVLALVAAGARPLAERRAAMTADALLLDRLDRLEKLVLPAPTDAVVGEIVATEPHPEPAGPSVTEPKPDAPEVGEPREPDVAPTPDPEPAVDPDQQPEVLPGTVESPVPAPNPVPESEPVIEEAVAAAVAVAEPEAEPEAEAEAETEAAEPEVDRDALRKEMAGLRREMLRAQVHGQDATTAAGKVPPQFLANIKGKSDKKIPETERQGKGGYPIRDAQSLKNAIQAFGRAKPEDKAKTKAHIVSAAKKLGLSKMLPEGW